MKLNTNMRGHLNGDKAAADFANFLLGIGDGQIPLVAEPDTIVIPTDLGKCVANLEELKHAVFPNLVVNATRPEWLAERAILSPLNTNVKMLNTWLMNEFPGEEMEYRSVDSAMNDNEAVHYPVEFLNSLELSGIPTHILKLKVGSPIMILRSIEPPKTTNGTRCVVTRLHRNLIEGTIACGPFKGEVVLLPKIPLIPSDSYRSYNLISSHHGHSMYHAHNLYHENVYLDLIININGTLKYYISRIRRHKAIFTAAKRGYRG